MHNVEHALLNNARCFFRQNFARTYTWKHTKTRRCNAHNLETQPVLRITLNNIRTGRFTTGPSTANIFLHWQSNSTRVSAETQQRLSSSTEFNLYKEKCNVSFLSLNCFPSFSTFSEERHGPLPALPQLWLLRTLLRFPRRLLS